MNVALFYNVATNIKGGSLSFLMHLRAGLHRAGHTGRVTRVGTRDEPRTRLLGGAVPYQNVSVVTALSLAAQWPALVTCVTLDPKAAHVYPLIAAGVPAVLHDPAELAPELLAALRAHDTLAVAIRPRNATALAEQGCRAAYLPHPYAPAGEPRRPRTRRAVSCARVDFRKHTDVIARANAMVAPEQRVQMYGDPNRLFVYHVLNVKYPGWEANYHGAYPVAQHAAQSIAREAELMVDLTAIKGDGGGTQYVFFEAWDAHAALVVNRAWLTPEGALRDGENCIAASTPDETAVVLRGAHPPLTALVEGGRALMHTHDATKMAALCLGTMVYERKARR